METRRDEQLNVKSGVHRGIIPFLSFAFLSLSPLSIMMLVHVHVQVVISPVVYTLRDCVLIW